MNNHLREQLLGYLLDALDEEERLHVERQLEDDPTLWEELQLLRKSIDPLREGDFEIEPPPGLAQRACAQVAAHRDREPVETRAAPLAHGMPESLSTRARTSVADVVVTAGIVLAAVMIFFPAIASSRYASRLKHCQNNLRQLGLALVNYSDKLGGGFFPCVASEGNRAFAGVYAPTLVDTGYLDDPGVLICPASPQADESAGYRLPTLAEIDQAAQEAIFLIHQRTGGSYGYSLGVVTNGRYAAPRNQGRASFPLMSDAPQVIPDQSRHDSHAGRGRNFLYEDGHVEFISIAMTDSPWRDHPFRNRHGNVEAGVDEHDAVIGASYSSPFPRSVLPRPQHR